MFQHYYGYHKNKIKESLEREGIGTKNLTDEQIARAYANNPKAQIHAQNILEGEQEQSVLKLKKEFNLTTNDDTLKFMVHYLGEGNARKYIKLYKKYGEKEADRIMAYGDPKEPDIKPIGGPDSARPNVLVSDHIVNFNNQEPKLNLN